MTKSRVQEPDAEQVAAFLEQHPDFFVEREALLAEMRIPHQRGSSISLVERQLSLLRERNGELRQRLAELMDVARDNDRLFDKTRALVLELLDSNTLEDAVIAVEDSLRNEFRVPYVSLLLFSDTPLPVGRSVSAAEAKQAIGGLLSGGKTVSGVLRPHELAFLFGEPQGDGIGSAAVSAITHQGLQGVLAVGSDDPRHYRSSIGTLFLGYITDVLGRVLTRFPQTIRSVR